uniref:AIG1-type G domain-containing protein n=1 Tax=Panagrolaimus sp. PS1159 TaxID=55785 RepID=A0AC35GKT4_9BILA
MTVPSFLFRENNFSLGQSVDPTTFELLPSRILSKISTIEIKRKQKFVEPSMFKYSLELVNPVSIIDDLFRLFKVPKSLIFQLYECGHFDFLLKHFFGKPAVLVNFQLCDKTQTIFHQNANGKDSFVTRIDCGYQFFAVIQSSDNVLTNITFKNNVEESLNLLFKNEVPKYVHGSCALVFPDHECQIQPFSEFFKLIRTAMKNESNYKSINVYLHGKLDLNDDRNFDQLLRDISYCKDLAKTLRQSIPITKGYQKVTTINANDIVKLKDEIVKSFKYPLADMNLVLEYCQIMLDSFKDFRNNIFAAFSVLKSLLDCAIQVTKKFIYLNDYWFLLCDEAFLKEAPPGTRFFISNGNNDSTYYDIFLKEGFIFVTLNCPDPSENDLFFVAGDNIGKKSYGVAYSTADKKLCPWPSSRLLIELCRCGKSGQFNYWICDTCKSFFFYHQKRPEFVSCKCYSVKLSTLLMLSSQKVCFSSHDFVNYEAFMGTQRQLYKNCYNVLIMGPSGAGKSTLVNGIANYLKHETLREAEADNYVTAVIPCQFEVQDDDYNGHIVKMGNADEAEENFNSLGHSVTQKPKEYDFPIGNEEYIHIIDTPGLADSRGVKQDQKNLELIRQAIINVGELHALCFVLKPNESKLTIGLETTMRLLLSIFPKKALDSVLFLFTNSRGTFYKPGDTTGPITKLITDLQKECGANINFGRNNIFCTDNEGFRYLCAKACKVDYTTATHRDYEDSWKHSRNATISLINRIRHEKPFDTRIINFYTELRFVTQKWAEWIKNCNMSAERCKRFGTIVYELEKNMIGTNCNDLVELSKSKKFKEPRYVADFMGIMNILHEEFVSTDLDYNVANEIRVFLDRYIFQF